MPELDLLAGYVESSQALVNFEHREWPQAELLGAAERAALRNTGWPLGLVLRTADGHKPMATADGVEFRINWVGYQSWSDYWFFQKDGRYYVTRRLEEDLESPSFQTSVGHPDRPLWFDIRVWRVAELLLHGATLYRELGIPPDEPYAMSISHFGLKGREFWTSTPERFVRRGRFCRENDVRWTKELTQDLVQASLTELTEEVVRGLFVLFDFMEVPHETIQDLVGRFEGRT